jgi:hypothetical protein
MTGAGLFLAALAVLAVFAILGAMRVTARDGLRRVPRR